MRFLPSFAYLAIYVYRNIPAVTFSNHVFTHRFHGFARNNIRTNRGLDRHIKHLARISSRIWPATSRPRRTLFSLCTIILSGIHLLAVDHNIQAY